MPHLLYTAKQPDGRPARGFVEADGVASARRKLAEQGLQNIVFHQDASVSEDSAALARLSDAEVDDLARLKLQVMREPGLKTVLLEVARRNRIGLLVDGLMLGWGLWTGNVLMVAIATTLAISPFALTAWRHRHADRYQAFLRAHALGDVARARQLAAQLRAVGSQARNLAFDLDVRLAGFQAREGQLDQALASLAPWRERMAGQMPLFETRLASVHAAAGDRAGFVAAMARGHALASDDPSRTLDLALAEARFGDVDRAQTLLDRVDPALIPAHGAGFVLWARGMCLVRQGQPAGAATLGLAVAEFLKLGARVASWTALAFCVADHALALATAGRQDEAKRELGMVWPVLQAHADKTLMQMLRTLDLVPA